MRRTLHASATVALSCLALAAAAQPTATPANEAGAAPAAPADAAPAPAPAAPSAAPPAEAPTPPPTAQAQPADEGAAQPVTPAPQPAPAPTPTPPAAAPPDAAPAPPAAEGAAFDQRGKSLYIRLALGFAIPVGPDIADSYAMRGGRALQFSGVSLATDWMGGFMPVPWLALGIGAASDTIVSGSLHYANNTKQSLASSLYYVVVGPFADVYFSPPAGWHVQALLGIAHLSRADDLSRDATGFGAVLGAGYDLAVARRWNIGGLVRMAISPLSTGASGANMPSPTVFEPSLLFTGTFRPEH